jgi:GT2 family glycosyltransferase
LTGTRLTAVVASVNGFPYLGRCLEALSARVPDAEVVVADCTDAETRARVGAGWPSVTVLAFDEPTSVPALRAAGIFAATRPLVAVLEDHCVVGEGWAAALERAMDGAAAAGGPIDNHGRARIRDWAAFLFEYSAFLGPGVPGEDRTLPGMNVCYSGAAVEAMADLLRSGRWESWLHSRLAERGLVLRWVPDASIEHDMDFDVGSFVAQRFHYARSYAAMRNPDLGWRRLLHLVTAPLLVVLLYARVVRNVLRSGRHRGKLVLATPLLFLYTSVTAAGEAVGYAIGGGRSLLRVR